jgi:type II secretory pathway pseudopilin PulG
LNFQLKFCHLNFKLLTTRKGFSLLEVVVGISIIFLALFSLAMISRGILVARQQASLALQANFLLEEGAEAIRLIRDKGWTTYISGLSGTNYLYFVAGGSTSTWQTTTTPETIGVFGRSFTVSAVRRNGNDDIDPTGTNDPSTRLFDVTVAWPGSSGTSTRSVSFYLTNYFND